MGNTRHNASAMPDEKKRLRDRRAQKSLRDRRDAQLKSLEERVAFCERHHGDGCMHQFMTTLDGLRRENERLQVRQDCLRRLVRSWDPPTSPTIQAAPVAPTDTDRVLSYQLNNELNKSLPPFSDNYKSYDGPTLIGDQEVAQVSPEAHQSLVASIAAEPLHPPPASEMLPALLGVSPTFAVPNSVPRWCLTPVNEYGQNPSFIPATCPWLARPDLIAACPPVPSPLDLLYGTRRNFLADQIHRAVRQRLLRDPECLATGWLIYAFSKWRVSPNPATFARLPVFLHPLMIQLQQGHPNSLDLIPWPQLRINLIENWPKYDYVELVGFLACCTKLRWPWGKEILERDSDDTLQIRQEFFDIFTRESGFGLTVEFIQKYPELMKGMDVQAIRYHVNLP